MAQTIEEKLKKYLGDKLVFNEPLDKYTTFKIGGPAKYFYVAKTKENLIEALRIAKRIKLPYFVLGKGSNILVSDIGFNGLVIKVENNKIEKRDNVRNLR